jgi:hypothetical protein
MARIVVALIEGQEAPAGFHVVTLGSGPYEGRYAISPDASCSTCHGRGRYAIRTPGEKATREMDCHCAMGALRGFLGVEEKTTARRMDVPPKIVTEEFTPPPRFDAGARYREQLQAQLERTVALRREQLAALRAERDAARAPVLEDLEAARRLRLNAEKDAARLREQAEGLELHAGFTLVRCRDAGEEIFLDAAFAMDAALEQVAEVVAEGEAAAALDRALADTAIRAADEVFVGLPDVLALESVLQRLDFDYAEQIRKLEGGKLRDAEKRLAELQRLQDAEPAPVAPDAPVEAAAAAEVQP